LRAQDEILIALPVPVPPLKHVRSGLLCSSLKSLRERSLFDRYFDRIPPQHRPAILSLTAAEWLKPDLAFVHYEACEALKLSASEQIDIGMQVAQHLQRGFLSVIVRFAAESGVTPWTILMRYPKLWERFFDGSAVAVTKLGPKEARVQAAGFPLARIGYIRNAVAGIVRGVTEVVCTRVYVTALPPLCTDSTLGYRVSWA
jgi:hypothetical protein